MIVIRPNKTVLKQNGKTIVYQLKNGKWRWVMVYDHRTGEVKQYIPIESLL